MEEQFHLFVMAKSKDKIRAVTIYMNSSNSYKSLVVFPLIAKVKGK